MYSWCHSIFLHVILAINKTLSFACEHNWLSHNKSIIEYSDKNITVTIHSISNILVKILYNEIEQTLPIECKAADKAQCPAAPYYRWDDVRNFYSALLKN